MNEPKKKCRSRQRLLMLLLMLCSVTWSFAQVNVSGKVLDELNEPVIGAAVQVKGTSVGTITDLDGGFQVSVNDLDRKSVV